MKLGHGKFGSLLQPYSDLSQWIWTHYVLVHVDGRRTHVLNVKM